MKPIKTNSLKKKLNLEENNKIFLYQGALQYGRGIKIMLNLLKYFPNAHAVILGEGPYFNILSDFLGDGGVFCKKIMEWSQYD